MDMDVNIEYGYDGYVVYIVYIYILYVFDGTKTSLLLSFWMKHHGCDRWVPRQAVLFKSKLEISTHTHTHTHTTFSKMIKAVASLLP